MSNKSFRNRFNVFVVSIFLVFATTESHSQISITQSELPIVLIETFGQEISDEPAIIANMRIVNNSDGANYIGGPYNDYSGRISIEIRGTTSQSFPKKQYRVETQKFDGSNNNVSILGLPKENDWVLHGPYSDKSLIRNVFTYTLYSQLSWYSPRSVFCELLINGEYLGVYVLIEKIKVDQNRVDIHKICSDDVCGTELSGGYLLKCDRPENDQRITFYTRIKNISFDIEYPSEDSIVPIQKEYINNYIDSFEEVLFSDNFSDTATGYNMYISTDSFVDYFIINEISKNIDAYFLSTYFYKQNDLDGGKLFAGPVWDYNIAYGNSFDQKAYSTEGIIAYKHPWWKRLLADTCFQTKVNTRWVELRKTILSNESVVSRIDSLTNVLANASIRNYEKWDCLGRRTWPNYYVGRTFEDEIDFLKSWLINRLLWLDMNLPGSELNYSESFDYQTGVFPNPFLYFFTYVFSLEYNSRVSLELYNENGQFLCSIIEDEYYEAGQNMKIWNSFVYGNLLQSSFYVLVLKVNGECVAKDKIIKKM